MPDGTVREIKPRSIDVDFSSVPRHWLGGSVVGTHVANGVNLLFPAGERFFVRSVRKYTDRVKDPVLLAQIKGFFGQEGRHAKEHERFFEILEAQGYDIRRFLSIYEKLAYGILERALPSALALSTTAACEHFTAILAENALEARLLDDVAPAAMRELLLWHASEEIEHRAVAFDVLKLTSDSYALRVAGMALAASCLGGFWVAATLSLVAQEDGSARALWADWVASRKFAKQRNKKPVFLPGIRQYLRRDFHPLEKDLDSLASDYLASAGLS